MAIAKHGLGSTGYMVTAMKRSPSSTRRKARRVVLRKARMAVLRQYGQALSERAPETELQLFRAQLRAFVGSNRRVHS
jgi:hypothetical protein